MHNFRFASLRQMGEPLTIVGNIAIGCLVALELVCIVTIARAMYEVFIGWYRNAIGKLVPRGCSGPKLGLKAPEKPVGRGYDSPELFREDSWLRRTGRSRKETAVLEPFIGSSKASAEARNNNEKRVRALAGSARRRQG
jgi:hypothetical protein